LGRVGSSYPYATSADRDLLKHALKETDTSEIIGVGNSIPLIWHDELSNLPGEGWDWALKQGVKNFNCKRRFRTLSGLAISILPKYRGKGFSKYMVQGMKTIGERYGLDMLVVPVRPSLKSLYPLTPMRQYINWLNDQGLPFDPWVRVHIKLGAEIIKVCSASMRITGTIKEWEQRTEMRFPESGAYIIPGALVPIAIDHGRNQGMYIEPNAWLYHRT
jgi:hypothetical protein